MRILHIFGSFDPGGAELRTVRLIQAFAAAGEHHIWVAAQQRMGARGALGTEVPVRFPAEPAALVSGRPGLRRFAAIARALGPYDLVLSYGWGAMDVVLAHRLFGWRGTLPPLIHHEDGFDSAHPERDRRRVLYRRLALGGVSALVVPSSSLADFARTHWRVREPQLVQIANGVDLEASTAPARIDPLPGLDAMTGTVTVGTLARLRPEKNLPRLVRAVAAAGDHIRLIIAGEGPEEAAIVAASERHLPGRVLMAGYRRDIGNMLAQMDIFALSSDTEQAPVSMLEAMAAGLPIAAPAVGDIAAMVSAANAPFITPPGDEAALSRAIATLAADPALRRQVGTANAAHARAHATAQAMIARYAALYARVAGVSPEQLLG